MEWIDYTQNSKTNSETNSETDSETNESNVPLSIKYLIKNLLAKKYVLFTRPITKMKILLLRKILELGYTLDTKLHLVKLFIPKAKTLLKIESTQYIKEKILEIIVNICHVQEAVTMISKDVELVGIILRFFGICYNNYRLQKTLFKFLFLITCEIETNPTSIWTRHLIRFLVGPNIIYTLTHLTPKKQTRNGYIIINHNSFIDIIITLETLSGLLLPDGSSILERLFKIEDLVSALQMRSFMFLSKHARRVVRLVQLSRWIVVREWLILMTNITKMNCFKVKSRDFDLENDIDSVLSLDDMTGMLHMCRNVYYYEMLFLEDVWNWENIQLESMEKSIDVLHKIITLSLNSFLGSKTLPRMAEITSDILAFMKTNYFRCKLDLNDTRHVKQYLMHITKKWKCKDFMELFLISQLYPLIIGNYFNFRNHNQVTWHIKPICNISQRKKLHKMCNTCLYLCNTRDNSF